MEIRNSTFKDIDEIMQIFAVAREYMVTHGNKTQWEKGYPNENVLKSDIKNNNNYIIVDNGVIVGAFSFIIGEEPTYRIIKNGAWNYDKEYGTIHRVVSKGTTRGVARLCFEYCLNKINYIRIDTHKDNITMQAAIEKFGFRRCGNIYAENGLELIAYDYLQE